MATFQNRSRLEVRVARRPDLLRLFPFDADSEARQYLLELRAQGLNPRLRQHEDAILVRIRQKGFRPLQFTAASWDEAERSATRIEDERSRGLFVDYTQSLAVTYADLIRRYLIEEAPAHKGCEMETYKLNALLVDSGAEPVTRQQQQEHKQSKVRDRDGTGQRMRHAIRNLEWLHKPFALVQPTDIEEYIRDRLEHVKPGTVDREIDLLSAVTQVAITTWRYNVAQSPMKGVRRPRFFNERDRRLIGDEEVRLVAAAREEDRRIAFERRLEELLVEPRQAARRKGSLSSQKRAIAAAKAALLPIAEATATHVPMYETLILFQLMTAARRGEALDLVWTNVLDAERYAFFPETKNGRPRKVPLRQDLMEALDRLPRGNSRVFPVTSEQLRDAWGRICSRARIEDLHVHDLRHEALSRIAETGLFTLLDLQAISGHRGSADVDALRALVREEAGYPAGRGVRPRGSHSQGAQATWSRSVRLARRGHEVA